MAVATWWGWRRRQQILGLIDQLLLLLLEIAEAVLGAAPAIDEMNHGPHQITEIAAALKGMAAFLVPAEAIHQIIAGIFNVSRDGRHDLQELIEFLALGQVTAGQGRDPFLEESGFILGLVGQAPVLGAAAHQAGVAISQLQIGAIEHLAFKRFRIWWEIRGWGQEDHARQHIGVHLPNAAARCGDSQEAGSMRGVNSSGITPRDD
ncbi:hypothetical protein I1E95_15985 [Synechococcus sp. CBW1107]|uniref:hypothetical protein n=1 Tax=Synechococcus sp. CBW1107 TaxID=2789857 RepID=UPI0018CD29A5|nr:hypothetical protein [Synechococcus sp. CBW1107]QPN56532.1 hypothetical protein I1E95_15985 [Synechococcus sp. CBW1107]